MLVGTHRPSLPCPLYFASSKYLKQVRFQHGLSAQPSASASPERHCSSAKVRCPRTTYPLFMFKGISCCLGFKLIYERSKEMVKVEPIASSEDSVEHVYVSKAGNVNGQHWQTPAQEIYSSKGMCQSRQLAVLPLPWRWMHNTYCWFFRRKWLDATVRCSFGNLHIMVCQCKHSTFSATGRL